jgi:hypothetical protein
MSIPATRGKAALPPILFDLRHFKIDSNDRTLAPGYFDCGVYASPEAAQAAAAARAGKEGFRDYPEGFRVLAITVDQDRWPQGVADLHTPDLLPHEGSYCTPRPGPMPPPGTNYLWLYHFLIAADSEDDFMDDDAWKLIGYYSTRAKAEAAQRRAAALPGFRDWPGGFRIYDNATLNTGGWEDGFISWDEA